MINTLTIFSRKFAAFFISTPQVDSGYQAIHITKYCPSGWQIKPLGIKEPAKGKGHDTIFPP
jgi:hypothetical protein